jgi:hypothetical protein
VALSSRKSNPLRIAVGGLAVTFPFGGMFWHYMQFVIGLRRLGHEVLYIEDIGRWSYDPVKRTRVQSGAPNAATFQRNLEKLDPALAGAWMFRDAAGTVYGRNWSDAQSFCQTADLFLNISLSHNVRDDYGGAACTVLVDTDPVYTQALLAPRRQSGEDEEEAARVGQMLAAHDLYFTFGLNVAGEDCQIPTGGLTWRPLLQPVVMPCFERARQPVHARRRTFTTVASWEPHEALTRVGDVLYGGKSSEFERVLTLPAATSVPLELALSGEPPLDLLAHNGWRVVDGYEVSADPWRFQDYLAGSLGEFTVAKHAYVASRSGWFSDRSACYLALGVPVILQDTAFNRLLPTGEGLLTFRTPDEAAAAIECVAAEPEKHARAATDIAEEYFCADRTMAGIVEAAGAYV